MQEKLEQQLKALRSSGRLTEHILDLSLRNVGADTDIYESDATITLALLIKHVFKNYPKIHTLKLNNVKLDAITAHGLEAVLMLYGNSLSVFELNNCDLHDRGAEMVAVVMKLMPNLQSLKMRTNSIGTHGALALVDAIAANNNLSDFDISFNEIGDAATIKLANIMRERLHMAKPHIHALNVSDIVKARLLGVERMRAQRFLQTHLAFHSDCLQHTPLTPRTEQAITVKRAQNAKALLLGFNRMRDCDELVRLIFSFIHPKQAPIVMPTRPVETPKPTKCLKLTQTSEPPQQVDKSLSNDAIVVNKRLRRW